MITLGNEVQQKREIFRIHIRKKEIQQVYQKKRIIELCDDDEEDELENLIKNLDKNPQNIKKVAGNMQFIRIEHLKQDNLLQNISFSNGQYNQEVIEILQYLMLDLNFSRFIYKEQKEVLENILINLVETLVKQEEKEFWRLVKILICNECATMELKKGVYYLISGLICSKSIINHDQLQILILLLPGFQNESKFIFKRVRKYDKDIFKILISNIQSSELRQVRLQILKIFQIFINLCNNIDDLHLIINENFLQVIVRLDGNSSKEQKEILELLIKITQINIIRDLIKKCDGLLDKIIQIIEIQQEDQITFTAFKLIIRLKNLLDKKQFSDEKFDQIILQILNQNNPYSTLLVLDFIILENYQSDWITSKLEILQYSKNSRISTLSLELLNQLEQQ